MTISIKLRKYAVLIIATFVLCLYYSCQNAYAKLNKEFPIKNATQLITKHDRDIGSFGYRVISDTEVVVLMFRSENLVDESYYCQLITKGNDEIWFIKIKSKYYQID